MQLLNDLVTFLANPPGNLIYILAVIIALSGSLQGAISQLRASGYPQARRMVFGLSLLFAIQLVLFIVGGLIEQHVIQGTILLPVIDRAAMLISLIWIIWIWVFPEPSETGDVAAGSLSLLVVAALAFGTVARLGENPLPGTFNAAAQSFYWSLGAAIILWAGILLLLTRKPANWGTGLAVVVLAMLGFVLDMLLPAAKGDFSGVARFFMLTSFSLLLTLPMRFPTPVSSPLPRTVAVFQQKNAKAQSSEEEDHPGKPARERRRYSTDPKTLQSLLALAAETDVTKINQYIARSVAQALLADLCFLIYVGEDKNTLFVATGYDLIREEILDGGPMNKDSVPLLANAVMRGRSLRLPASTTSSDLKGLGDLLGLPNPGNLLNVPISSEKGTIGSILLLSPYSNRLWNADDQTFVTSIAASFVPIIERGRLISEMEHDREQARHSAEDAITQGMRLQAANIDLNNQLVSLKTQLEQVPANDGQKELIKRIEELEKEKEKLALRVDSAGLGAPVSSNNQLEGELRLALEETARLQNVLAASNLKIMELSNKPLGSLSTDQAEVVTSISQELRQPMSSIIGYTDLLLGESVGILGALQRKFIERVRASTERIGSLIDDLIHITTQDTGSRALMLETVDLNLIIDNAMAYTSGQLREKNITLRIDIPESLPPLQADREFLQQILIYLLQNAGAVSPIEGSVTLRVRAKKDKDGEKVVIQVTDTGGGIPKDDLGRVFSRLYRADNALIQGVGDTGVGLSIAKTLTDAQKGRIWVDTEMGSGSTFSVSLPLKPVLSESSQEA
ncbi:MAG: GAF domain-containing sensor histidine kinase [Chloroflexi bacterium]|nr:GAF domain-containing sensor histidine kinase [Chloroflexota bacterium]